MLIRAGSFLLRVEAVIWRKVGFARRDIVPAEGILLRPAVTLPVEIYSEERVREFDEAEDELSVVLRGKRKR